MKVVVIGAGNVAFHLGSLIRQNGHDILQLYNRSSSSGKKLAAHFSCEFTNKVSSIDKSADLYLVALKDDAIQSFCKQLLFNPKLIVHTSGTCSITIFPETFNAGVIYPVQSFSKNMRIPGKIPFCIEARKASSLKTIRNLISGFSDRIYKMNSSERERIHLAAVLVNNFTNYLFTLSEKYLESEQLSFDILRPLILETAEKVQKGRPEKMQTGPARRGDKKVISEHIRLLKDHPELKKIYTLFTKSIIHSFEHEGKL